MAYGIQPSWHIGFLQKTSFNYQFRINMNKLQVCDLDPKSLPMKFVQFKLPGAPVNVVNGAGTELRLTE